ncbi:MAG: hypothetical protein IPQ25_19225 [Chitinophagaceae bacterium]|nr:hypothetical protein [Chitinophagaceae bacterium]
MNELVRCRSPAGTTIKTTNSTSVLKDNLPFYKLDYGLIEQVCITSYTTLLFIP